jgi:hypothetical protein
MMKRTPLMRVTCQFLMVCFLLVSFQHAAMAGIVGTTDIVNQQQVQLNKQGMQDLLSRDDVQQQLTTMGIDPADAKLRIANMTDEEIQDFAANMGEQPAGGSVVGTLALIFIILLITDLMGYTDIFPFVKKTIQ